MAKQSTYPSVPGVPALTDLVPITSGGATKNVPVSHLNLRGFTVTVATSSSGFLADYICDGTSDEADINNAITLVNSLGGGTVKVLGGLYTLYARINMKSNVNLEGEGLATILKVLNGSSFSYLISISTPSSNWRIANMMLDDNSANRVSGGGAIIGSGPVSYGLIENVYAINGWNQGIYLGGATYCKIVNCRAYNNGTLSGIGFGFGLNESGGTLSAYNQIIGCHADSNQEGGFSLYGATTVVGAHHNLVSGCTSTNHTSSGGAGISVLNGQHNTVTGSVFSNNSHNIQVLYGAQYNNIVGNYTEGGVYGIWVTTSTNGHANNNNVTGNTCIGSSKGIYVLGADDVNVSGNKVMLSGNVGIQIESAQGCTVSGNTTNFNGQHGIELVTSIQCAITGNTANNNSTSNLGGYNGITLSTTSTRNTVTGNVACDNQLAYTTALTANASSGQAVIQISTFDLQVGQLLTISDSLHNENVVIQSIDSQTQATLTANLINSYTTANSAIITGRATQKYGIRELSVADDYNIISSNIASGNITGQIQSNGTHTVNSTNQTG